MPGAEVTWELIKKKREGKEGKRLVTEAAKDRSFLYS